MKVLMDRFQQAWYVEFFLSCHENGVKIGLFKSYTIECTFVWWEHYLCIVNIKLALVIYDINDDIHTTMCVSEMGHLILIHVCELLTCVEHREF